MSAARIVSFHKQGIAPTPFEGPLSRLVPNCFGRVMAGLARQGLALRFGAWGLWFYAVIRRVLSGGVAGIPSGAEGMPVRAASVEGAGDAALRKQKNKERQSQEDRNTSRITVNAGKRKKDKECMKKYKHSKRVRKSKEKDRLV